MEEGNFMVKPKSSLVLFVQSYVLENKYQLLLNVLIRNVKHKFYFNGTEIITGAAITDETKELFRSKLVDLIGYPPYDKRKIDKWFNNIENRSIVLENIW